MKATYEWYEIRPCLTFNGATHSFIGGDNGDGQPTPEGSFEAAAETAEEECGGPSAVFWTLYGRYYDTDADGYLSEAIGDFVSFEAAYDTMNRILAPLAAMRDAIFEETCTSTGGLWHLRDTPAVKAMILQARNADDIINQSSNDERL